MVWFLNFTRKNNFLSLLGRIRIKTRRSLADIFVSPTTENREVSSAKSLGFDDNPFDNSLMQIKNNKGPRIEPCGNLALTAAHL